MSSELHTQEEMTRDRFQIILQEVRNGHPAHMNDFFLRLFRKSISQLQKWTHSPADAQEAFAEVVVKFWTLFVDGDKPLPESNIEGYIFTMAKMYCLEKFRRKKNERVHSLEEMPLDRYDAQDTARSAGEWRQQQVQEDLEQEALSRALDRLEQNCRALFQMILDTGIDKPRDLWQPLGYKNARTLSSVKDQCLKKLKRTAALELELLQEAHPKHQRNVKHSS